nr:hypothetical protein [Rhizobium leguminosarum]
MISPTPLPSSFGRIAKRNAREISARFVIFWSMMPKSVRGIRTTFSIYLIWMLIQISGQFGLNHLHPATEKNALQLSHLSGVKRLRDERDQSS